MIESFDKFRVELEVPGCEKENISIESPYSRCLRVNGTIKESKKLKEDKSLILERVEGEFQREFLFPNEFLFDKSKATFKDGILTIELPKVPVEEIKGKRLEIE